jgi:hypothetical protein
MHAYPSDLTAALLRKLAERGMPEQVSQAHLSDVISVCYQASLLRDEERPVLFRVCLSSAVELNTNSQAAQTDGAPQASPVGPPIGLHPLAFASPRPFSGEELRRLSQAAKYHRSLIGVSVNEEARLSIWGIVHSGPGWFELTRRRGNVFPSGIVVNVAGPGRLTVSIGSETLMRLAGGKIYEQSEDVFESHWLSQYFAQVREGLLQEHYDRVSKACAVETLPEIDPTIIRRLGQTFVRKLLTLMRFAHHGGSIVFLPPETALQVTGPGGFVQIKYALEAREPRGRFRTLALEILRELTKSRRHTNDDTTIGEPDYLRLGSAQVVEAEAALSEWSHAIAALADVDGTIVLSTKFEVLGFGAEIVGDLWDVPLVARAASLEGDVFSMERTDTVGTRHRSMYRLCARVPEALGIVVSQDGGVRFVRQHDGRVTYWDQVSTATIDPA